MPIYKIDKKKDGLQCYRVQVNRNNNGRYRQIVRTAYGYDAAKRIEKELTSVTYNTMQTDELIDLYIREKDCRQSTRERCNRTLDRYVRGKFGRVDKINIESVAEWKNEIASLDLATTTKRNIFKELSNLFNFAVRRKIITDNYCKDVGGFKNDAKPTAKLQYYTADEWLKFASVAREEAFARNDYRYYVFFAVAFYTGMRKGEINALKWSDIKGNIIHIRRSLSQKIKGKDYVETKPKTLSSIRDIQIPAPLRDILAEHKHRQMRDRRFTEDYRVVGGADVLHDTNIENANKRYAEAANLHHIRIHDFRHSHASLLANNGINIQEIARRLGHANVQETWKTYAHLYPMEEERAVSVLNSVK